MGHRPDARVTGVVRSNKTASGRHRGVRRAALRTAALCSAAAGIVAASGPAIAAPVTITWNGSVDASWANGSNWDGGVAPNNNLIDHIALFDSTFGVSPSTASSPNAGTTQIAGLAVGAGRGGNAFTITTGTASGGLSIGSSGIDMSAASSSLVTTIGTGSTNLLTVAANQFWTVNTGAQLTINATTAIDNQITLNGGGTVRLAATNSGTGGIVLNSGTLITNANNATGTGALTISGGSLNTSGGFTLGNSSYNLNGDFTFIGTGSLNTGTGAVTLNSSRQITVSGSTLTVGGVISGTSLNALDITKSGAGTLALTNTTAISLRAGGQTLANNGGTLTVAAAITNGSDNLTVSGAGATTLSGIIGAGTGSVIKTGTGILTLTGANTFTGGLVIKGGTVVANVSNATGSGAAGPATSAITLGDSAGSAASLLANSFSVTNPINLATGAVGPLTIGNNAGTTAAVFSGAINLNGNDLTIATSGTGSVAVGTGGITGTGNLLLSSGATTATILLNNTMTVNNVGGITHTGAGTGTTTINSAIGSNVTTIVQNSASKLTLEPSGAGASNAFGALSIKSGTVEARHNTAAGNAPLGTGAATITLGDTAASTAGAQLNLQGSQAATVGFSNPLVLGGGTTGTLNLVGLNTGTGIVWKGGITGNNSISINNGGGGSANSGVMSFINNPIAITGKITHNTSFTTAGAGVAISGGIGVNVTEVVQNSTSKLDISGTNNLYSGPTTISLGTLSLSGGGTLAGTAISAAAGTTFLVSGNSTIGTSGSPSLTVAGGATPVTAGTLSLLGNSINTLNINSATPGATVLTLGGTSGNATQLNMEVGATADKIVLGGGLLASIGAGGVTVNLSVIGTLSGTSQTLISAPGGGLNTGGGFTLNTGTGSFGGNVLSLNTTSTAVTLVETPNATPNTIYFKGNLGATWNTFTGGNTNNSNWTTDAAGTTDPFAGPGANSDVHFYAANATTASLASTLGQNYTIKTLSMDGGALTSNVSIAPGGGSLTIAPADPATGITVASGAGTLGISAPVVLGATQAWTNASGSLMTVSGGVTGAGNLTLSANSTGGITISTAALNNAGTVTINGTGAGVTTISGGIGSNVTAITNSATAATTIGAVAINGNRSFTSTSGALLTFNGGVTGTGNVALNANGAGGITLSTASVNNAGTITNSGSGAGTTLISAVIGANVTGVLQNSSTSTLTLSGANSSYAGGVTLAAGTLNVNNAAALGTGTLTINGVSTLNNNSGGAVVATGLSGVNISSDFTIGNTNSLNLSVAPFTITGDRTITALAGGGGGFSFGNISAGTSTLTFTGTGLVHLLGSASNVSGPVTSSLTTLNLNKSAGNAIGAAGLTITAGTVTIIAANQIDDAAAVLVSGGTLAGTTVADTIGSLSVSAGSVTGTGPITIAGASPVNVTPSSGTATVSKPLVLGTGGLSIAPTGTGAVTYSGAITSTAGATVTVSNAGTGSITLGTGSVNHSGNIVINGTGTGALTLSAPIGPNVGNITHTAAGNLTFSSATVANTGNILFNAGGATTVTFSAASINNAGTITNSGTTTGTTAVSGVIGAAVTGIVQNSPTSVLNLSGANTAMTAPISVKAGTITATSNVSAYGTGTITLGDAAVDANATLIGNVAGTLVNPIVLASGVTKTLTIGSPNSGTQQVWSGGVTGTNNLVLSATNNAGMRFTTSAVNNTGTVTSVGTGAGGTIIDLLGSNVISATQAGTSPFTISSAYALTAANKNVVSTGAGAFNFNGGITGAQDLTLSANAAGGINFGTAAAVNNAGTITNNGTGAGTATISGGVGSNVTAITLNSTTSALTIATNPVTVNTGGTTLNNLLGTKALTVSGGVTGAGNLLINNASSLASGITLTTAAVNNTGTVSNLSTGSGAVTITGGIGANVTSIIENSATSALTVSTTAVTVNSGGTTVANNNASGSSLLSITGGTTGTGPLVLNNNSAIAGGVTVSGTAVNHTGLLTNSGTGSGSTIVGAVIGVNVTGITQNSATSLLNLSGTNLLTGPTTITAGTLQLSGTGGSNAAGSTYTVNGTTARLLQGSTTAISVPVTLTQGALEGAGSITSTVSVANNASAVINPGAASVGTLTIGTLNFNGAATVNFAANGTTVANPLTTTTLSTNAAGSVMLNATNSGVWSNTTYNLIGYTGTIGGAGFGKFSLGTVSGLGPRQAASLTNPTGFVALSINGDSPVWTGLVSNDWSAATIPSPKNWKLITAGTETDFLTGDTVLFDDTASPAGPVMVNISAADVTPVLTTFNNVTKSYVLNGPFAIAAGSLTKSGAGTLTINTANTYAGATTIQAGTVKLGVDNALPTGTALVLGNNLTGVSSTQGTLDLNGFNQTVGSLTIQSDSTTANQILVPAGKTLTVNGNVVVGEINTATTTPRLTMTGGGALVVNNPAANGSLQVGANTTQTTSSGNNAVVDFSGLDSVSITLNTSSGAVYVGDNIGNNANSGVASSLFLPTTGAGNTTITAAVLAVGPQGRNMTGSPGVVNVLKLGSGANVFNVNELDLGGTPSGTVRDAASITFANANGTFKLRDAAGTGRVAVNLNANAASNTAALRPTTLDLSGHSADLLISTLTIGDGGGSGNQTNTFSFDTGTLDVTGIVMARRSSGTANTFASTINFGSSPASTGTVTVGAGGIVLLNQPSSGLPVSGTLNILGGTVTLGGDIRESFAAASTGHTGTITLDGGTLDMGGFKIGGSTTTSTIDALNFKTGTLKNVAEINSGAALNKATAGVLNLAGNNTYSGATSISAGVLLENSTHTNAGNYTITAGGTLGGSGVVTLAAGKTVNATGTVGSPATISPGPIGGIGTLTANVSGGGTSVVIGDYGNLAVDLGAGVSDRLAVGGDLNLSSTLDSVTFTGTADSITNYVIATYSGSLNGTFDVVNNLPAGYTIDYGTGTNSQISLVPEPATLGLAAVGALGLLGKRRRRAILPA